MSAQRSHSTRRHLRAVSGTNEISADPTDESLVEAIALGDARVAAHVHQRLLPVVDRALYRVLGYRGFDHDDLIQATFEQVILTIQRGAYSRACSLPTWATAIASRIGLNALRSRRRERSVFDTIASYESPLLGSGLEAEIDARAEVERLRIELAGMKPGQAEAVFLHDVLGYTLRDISQMCGVTNPAAQSRLLRGRQELFRRMGWPLPEERS